MNIAYLLAKQNFSGGHLKTEMYCMWLTGQVDFNIFPALDGEKTLD